MGKKQEMDNLVVNYNIALKEEIECAPDAIIEIKKDFLLKKIELLGSTEAIDYDDYDSLIFE